MLQPPNSHACAGQCMCPRLQHSGLRKMSMNGSCMPCSQFASSPPPPSPPRRPHPFLSIIFASHSHDFPSSQLPVRVCACCCTHISSTTQCKSPAGRPCALGATLPVMQQPFLDRHSSAVLLLKDQRRRCSKSQMIQFCPATVPSFQRPSSMHGNLTIGGPCPVLKLQTPVLDSLMTSDSTR